MNKARSKLQAPVIKNWNGAELTKLRDRMFNCETVHEARGRLSELNSQDVLLKLFEKIPHKTKVQFVPLERSGLAEPEEGPPYPQVGGGRAKRGTPNLTKYLCYGL